MFLSLFKYVSVAGGYCLHHYYFHALKRDFFIGSDFWVSFAGLLEDLKSNLNACQDIIMYLQTITYLLF